MSWVLRGVQAALRSECFSGASCEMMGENGERSPEDREENWNKRTFFSSHT